MSESMKLHDTFKGMWEDIEEMREKEFPKNPKMNILDVIHRTRHENHNSDIIAYLLDPYQKHYQGKKYLEMFLEKVGLDINSNHLIEVFREYLTNENRRIDIYIDSKEWGVIIESKIGAEEQENQLNHYYEFITGKYPNKKIYILFLTLGGSDSETLCESVKNNKTIYRNITWEHHILAWIESVLAIQDVDNNLKEGLKQYKDSLDILTNKTNEDIMEQTTILESLINNKGELTIDLDSKAFENLNKVSDWLSTLAPLLKVKKELEKPELNQEYTVELVLGTCDTKDLDEYKPFTIEKYIVSTDVTIKITKGTKTIYYAYNWDEVSYYYYISKQDYKLDDYTEEDEGYNFYWKHVGSKGAPPKCEKTLEYIKNYLDLLEG